MTGDFLIVKKYLSNPLVTGTIFLTLAGTTSRFMGFFFRIFLNNVMGSTGLGLYQLVIPLMSVCMSLCCNGFQTATSKLVAEKPQNRQIIPHYRKKSKFYICLLIGLKLFLIKKSLVLENGLEPKNPL